MENLQNITPEGAKQLLNDMTPEQAKEIVNILFFLKEDYDRQLQGERGKFSNDAIYKGILNGPQFTLAEVKNEINDLSKYGLFFLYGHMQQLTLRPNISW